MKSKHHYLGFGIIIGVSLGGTLGVIIGVVLDALAFTGIFMGAGCWHSCCSLSGQREQ